MVSGSDIFAVGFRRFDTRAWLLYIGDSPAMALATLNEAIELRSISHGRVQRRDGSIIYVVDPPELGKDPA
jgi:hypothetical protein